MTKKNFVIAFRLAFAALALAGVVVQLGISLSTGFGAVNFFSYFTILSNIFASVVFIISAVRLARNYRTNDRDVAIRGASVVYMVFVGAVFNTLLRDVDLGGLLPWINMVHHFIMPLAVLVDWIVWPPRSSITLKTVLLWMIFPVVYVVYSLIRGAMVGFYPYPFLDPTEQGYPGVVMYCVALVLAFAALALLIRWIANRVQR